jgi:hypothetical protein
MKGSENVSSSRTRTSQYSWHLAQACLSPQCTEHCRIQSHAARGVSTLEPGSVEAATGAPRSSRHGLPSELKFRKLLCTLLFLKRAYSEWLPAVPIFFTSALFFIITKQAFLYL